MPDTSKDDLPIGVMYVSFDSAQATHYFRYSNQVELCVCQQINAHNPLCLHRKQLLVIEPLLLRIPFSLTISSKLHFRHIQPRVL